MVEKEPTFDEFFDDRVKVEMQCRAEMDGDGVAPTTHILTTDGALLTGLCLVQNAEELRLAISEVRKAVAQEARRFKYIVTVMDMLLSPPPGKDLDPIQCLVAVGQHEFGMRYEVYGKLPSDPPDQWRQAPSDKLPKNLLQDFDRLVDWYDEPSGPAEMFPRIRGL